MHFQSTVAGGALVKLTDTDVASGSTFPLLAVAALRFEADGQLSFTANGVITPSPDEWYIFKPEAGIGSNYEARLTVKSGDAPTSGPAPGVWISLDNLRVWSLDTAGIETLAGGWEVEIRQAAAENVVASATYTMSATTTP